VGQSFPTPTLPPAVKPRALVRAKKFLYLVPGTHEVLVEKARFHNVLFKDMAVNVGTAASIRPQMTLGRVEAVVRVTGAPALAGTA